MATVKKVNTKGVEENSANVATAETETIPATVVVDEAPVEKNPAKVNYSGDTLIPCRSVTQGELLYRSKKTDNFYKWAAFGDITEMEYQDLVALKAQRSGYIYEPYFIVEDDDLLNDPKWNDVKELYATLIDAENLFDILNLPNDQFQKVFASLPSSLKRSVAVEVSTRLDAGTFDSTRSLQDTVRTSTTVCSPPEPCTFTATA